MSGPVYTFYPDTPNASDPMNETQPLILSNFQAIPELLSVNHVTWSDENASNSFGGHNFLSLPFPSSETTPTNNTDINLFTQATPSGPNAAEMYWENSTSGLEQISFPTGGDVIMQVPTTPVGLQWGSFGNNVYYYAYGGPRGGTTYANQYSYTMYFGLSHLTQNTLFPWPSSISGSLPIFYDYIFITKVTPAFSTGVSYNSIYSSAGGPGNNQTFYGTAPGNRSQNSGGFYTNGPSGMYYWYTIGTNL